MNYSRQRIKAREQLKKRQEELRKLPAKDRATLEQHIIQEAAKEAANEAGHAPEAQNQGPLTGEAATPSEPQAQSAQGKHQGNKHRR